MLILEGVMPLIWWGISALALLLCISFLMVFILTQRMKHFESSYTTLQKFKSDKELESMLQEYIQNVDQQKYKLETLNKRLNLIELKLRASFDRAELLRFRAFENVGSDQSFAFALVNQEGTGVVLSSIHNREESRVYAKPVNQGLSSYTLTKEEQEVIATAMNGPKV